MCVCVCVCVCVSECMPACVYVSIFCTYKCEKKNPGFVIVEITVVDDDRYNGG